MELLQDIYIRDRNDSRYNPNRLEVKNKLEALISKIKMILLTNKGEVYGFPDFGMDLEKYLFEETVNKMELTQDFYAMLGKYVPEISEYNIDFDVEIRTSGSYFVAYLNIYLNGNKFMSFML